jgi:hypothetical protein
LIGPSFDPGEQALDARLVSLNVIDDARHRPDERVALPVPSPVHQERDEVFSAGQHEYVRLFRVLVLWQTFVRLACDRGKRETPPEAKRSVAGTGVVVERQLRAKPGPSGTGGDGDAQGPGACGGIRPKLFADAADRPTTFRERDGGGDTGALSPVPSALVSRAMSDSAGLQAAFSTPASDSR